MPSLKWVDDATCQMLVEKCLKEDWELLDYRKGEKYWVLKRYLRETFNRLVLEDEGAQPDARRKILVDEAQGLAVFNTGIADPHYRNIYALLEETRNGDGEEFAITGFFVNIGSDGSAAYKKAHRVFGGNLPPRARYSSRWQSMFNPGWQWEPAYSHIIYDRLFRFPLTYIEKAVNSQDVRGKLIDVLGKARLADDSGDKKTRDAIMTDEVRPILDQGDKALYRKFYNDLSKAIQTSRRRSSFDWGVAMLGYYPKEKQARHYVPICLEYEEQPDFALVLSAQNRNQEPNQRQTNFYVGTTILPLDAAYADTRLVMKPAGNWIDAAAVEVRQSNNERFLAPRTAVAPDFINRNARARLLHDGKYDDVQPGDVLGVKRGADDRYNPDIVLDAGYKFISNKHGEFNCRNGVWTFTSFGRNGTALRRGGDLYTLERGIPFELLSDDELYFGGHGGNELYGGGSAISSEASGFVFVVVPD